MSVATEKSLRQSPADLFRQFAHEPGAIWLDSALRVGDRGHLSILARNPKASLSLRGGEISANGKRLESESGGIRSFLEYLITLVDRTDHMAIGFITYEAMLPFVGLPSPLCRSFVPSAEFYFYDKALKYDTKAAMFVPFKRDHEEFMTDVNEHARSDRLSSERNRPELVNYTPREEYLECVHRVKRYITEGDIYQANYTTRMDIRADDSPLNVYYRLRSLNPAPYCAFINGGDYHILSSSPERMFFRNSSFLTTGPIKGTIRSHDTPEDRATNRKQLLSSEKDRAELLMIVDLLRNDLGRVARTGTVTVDRLFGAESYASLIHLVSDISCTIDESVSTAEIIEFLTPGGSITGAPKKRAVEILQSLETAERSVYTGCIGYITREKADFSIAIRTMTHTNGTYHIHAGGGIVADSDPAAEYDEMMLKASKLIQAVKG